MSSAKKQNASHRRPCGWEVCSLAAGRWPAGADWLLLVLGLFGGGAYLAWRKFKPRILVSPEYRVGPEQVEITPPPADLDSQRYPGRGFSRSIARRTAFADG